MTRFSGMMLLASMIVLTSCGTVIKAHRITAGAERGNGIPFYMPRALLHVQEPIETERTELLYALLDLNGIHQFLYEIDTEEMDGAIAELAAILKVAPTSVTLAAAERPGGILVEESTSTVFTGANARTESDTKKYSLSSTVAPSEGKSELLFKPADASKSFSVILVPDTTREYELRIDPGVFASGNVTLSMEDGWRLTGINVTEKTNEALVASLTSVASAAITSNQAIRVAEIGMEQALQLQQLQNATGGGSRESETATPSEMASIVSLRADLMGRARLTPTQFDSVVAVVAGTTEARLSIAGYLKRIRTIVIQPAVYDLMSLVNGGAFRRSETVFWQRMSFTQPAPALSAK
jgi:hypothetical protein